MRYLILFDRTFPFKSGETFLENEIEEISKHFDKVIIYPIDICKGEEQTRKIKSTNVDSRPINDKNFQNRKFKYLVKSIVNKTKISKNIDFKCKFYEKYFITISKDQTERIKQDLENNFKFEEKDEVILYSYWLYTTAKIICNLKQYFAEKNIKTTLISRAHRFDIYEERNKLKYLPQREELLNDLDAVFVCSNDGEEYIKNKYKKYASKIYTSYLGTYNQGISEYKTSDKIEIVSCSNVIPVKRVDLIIKALETLKDSDINIEWTHIGGGKLFEKVKKEAEEKLSFMKVNFLGKLPNYKVYEYYKQNQVKVFINVSSSEGLPVSIMEAISFGIPVIATKVGGTPEIVQEDKNGDLLDKEFTCKELADKIVKYAKMNDEEYLGLRKNTRKLWEDYFQANINYEKFIEDIKGIKR